jgi:hypothetical protein
MSFLCYSRYMPGDIQKTKNLRITGLRVEIRTRTSQIRNRTANRYRATFITCVSTMINYFKLTR